MHTPVPGGTVLSPMLVWLFVGFSLASALAEVSTPPTPPVDDAKPSDPSVEDLLTLSLEDLSQVRVAAIATGSRLPVMDSPSIATVIKAEEIEAMGATTFGEALQVVPGLHVSASGQSGTVRYYIRAISTLFNPQTLVMINGIPITSLVRGDRLSLLGVFPVRMISRIEIIRGPGSALYGADAFAGVINVITKSASEIDGTDLGGSAGSFETYRGWLLHSEEANDLKVSLMADYRQTEGHKREITVDAQTALDRAQGTQASLAPGPMSNSGKWLGLMLDMEKSKWRLRGTYYGLSNGGSGPGTAQALDPNGRVSQARTTADLTFHDPLVGQNWDLTSRVSYLQGAQEIDKNLLLFPPGADLGQGVFADGVLGTPEFWERQFRFDNFATFRGIANHQIRLGVGYFFGHLYRVQNSKNASSTFEPLPAFTDVSDTPDTFLPENSRFNYYAYAQDEWALWEDWTLTVGARFDHYSDFGDTLNPRAGLVWKATPDLTTRFLYGRAFRAPTFAELYTINNPVNIGNPNLEPETINVLELGLAYRFTPDWNLGLNVFHYDIDNLIDFVRNTTGTATAQNFGKQTASGLEFETKFRLIADLLFTGNYSFVDPEDENTNEPSGNYPNHIVYLRGDWIFLKNWSFGTQFNWIGPQDRIPSDTRAPLKDYATVDLILRRAALFDRLYLTASVRNLFDADAREPSQGPGPTAAAASIPNDIPLAGRSAFAELSFRF